MKVDFEVMNNVADYKAYITGMQRRMHYTYRCPKFIVVRV